MPVAVLFDEVNETVDGIILGDVHLDALLTLIEADTPGSSTDIAIIGISHLTGAVDDASHHPDFEVCQVGRGLLYTLDGGLEVKHGSAATWAGDELGFARALA